MPTPNSFPFAPSIFELLPKGLQEIELGVMSFIERGPLNLARFENLRIARLRSVATWEVLASLPSSLEDLQIWLSDIEDLAAVFPLSSLPPKIRACELRGSFLTFNLNCKAPSTLEELILDLEDCDLNMNDLKNFFNAQNLRKLDVSRIYGLKPSDWAHLPNLEDHGFEIPPHEAPSLDLLPRKLKTLFVHLPGDEESMNSFKDIPPSLTDLSCAILHSDHFAQLPRTLKSLKILESLNYTPPFSVAAWSGLPPQSETLSAIADLFESEACLHVLPKTLKALTLNFSSSLAWTDRISLPETLQQSLKKLLISASPYPDDPDSSTLSSSVFKLNAFSVLSSIEISAKTLISSDNLSHLPQSLTELKLQLAETKQNRLNFISSTTAHLRH